MRNRALALVPCVLLLSLTTLARQTAPPADDPVSGEWDAVAYYDQQLPFSLTLALNGTAVTGTAATGEGTQEIRNGKWEDATLSFEITYQGAPVAMSATAREGKLDGSWIYNGGEATGRWEATRKPKAAAPPAAR
jgi:hypothetical protein